MALGAAARRKLGGLVDLADHKVRDVIMQRGGNASNVRHTGHWADRTLGEAAEAAVQGDQNAAAAIKIAKQAKSKAEEH